MTEVLMEADPIIFDKEVITSLIKGQRWGPANTTALVCPHNVRTIAAGISGGYLEVPIDAVR